MWDMGYAMWDLHNQDCKPPDLERWSIGVLENWRNGAVTSWKAGELANRHTGKLVNLFHKMRCLL